MAVFAALSGHHLSTSGGRRGASMSALEDGWWSLNDRPTLGDCSDGTSTSGGLPPSGRVVSATRRVASATIRNEGVKLSWGAEPSTKVWT